MDLKKKAFLLDVGKELPEENVAVFAGAGANNLGHPLDQKIVTY
jgi:hypothetical protein